MPRDVYTDEMGNPPSPDEGAPAKVRAAKKPVRRPPDVYVAEMGNPPSPDEGPVARMPARRGAPQALRGARPFAKGGSVGSASKRADGIASKGKTKGRMC